MKSVIASSKDGFLSSVLMHSISGATNSICHCCHVQS